LAAVSLPFALSEKFFLTPNSGDGQDQSTINHGRSRSADLGDAGPGFRRLGHISLGHSAAKGVALHYLSAT
jgi:hypothetical protein